MITKEQQEDLDFIEWLRDGYGDFMEKAEKEWRETWEN